METKEPNEITLTVLKFEMNFTRRTKDMVKNHWFSCPNDILTHPDFEDLTAEEWKWFFYLVSVCSKTKKGTITIKMDNSVRVGKLEISSFRTMMIKLDKNQVSYGECLQHELKKSSKSADHAATDGGQHMASTRPLQTDKTDSTGQDSSRAEISTADDFVIELGKEKIIADVLPFLSTNTVESLRKYEISWLKSSLEHAITHNIEKSSAQNASGVKNWNSRLIKWFNDEKKPRYCQIYAKGAEFLKDLKLQIPQDAEVGHENG